MAVHEISSQLWISSAGKHELGDYRIDVTDSSEVEAWSEVGFSTCVRVLDAALSS